MSIKTALSLPKEQFGRFESLRKKLGMTRSALIQRLIAQWLERLDEEALILQYLKGYQRTPENDAEIKAAAAASAQVITTEGLGWNVSKK